MQRPADTSHLSNVESMLGQRRRWWPSIDPTLGQCLVLAGISRQQKSANVVTFNIFYKNILSFDNGIKKSALSITQDT